MKYNWLETRPNGDSNYGWTTAAINGDGVHMLAGITTGRLYVSNDSGLTWRETQPAGNVNTAWRCTAMSYSGQYMVAAVYSGRVWISNDYGATWAETRPAGNANINWTCVAMSWDGQTIYIGEYRSFGFNCGLWKTSTFGANWAVCGAASNANAITIACSANGQIVYYGAYNSRFYVSFNGATNWTERRPVGVANKYWQASCCDSIGEKVYAGIDSAADGRIYYSKDYGASWTEVQPMGNNSARWKFVRGNTDLTNIAACSYAAATQGRVYTMGNDGLVFQEERPGGADSSLAWIAFDMSKDGSTLIAGVEGARLYIGRVNLNNKILNII